MLDRLTNLIIPRININSEKSIEEAVLLVKEYGFDSFILFAGNEIKFGEGSRFKLDDFYNIRKILNQELTKEVLFFIDAENGFGRRCLEGNKFDLSGVEFLDYKNQIDIFDSINLELYKNKISFNLAPVVDISNEESEVLKGRTFSSNPSKVSNIARIFLDSALKNKIIGCLKHFPGHGVVKGDTHNEIIKSSISPTELKKIHIKPFIDLLNQTEMIMINHINYTKYDNDLVPASMSYEIMTNLLLNEIHYKGIIISDSIRMGSITSNFKELEMIRAFIINGGDLILDPFNPIACLNELKKIYLEIPKEIERKTTKVLDLKEKARNQLIK